MLNWHRNKFNIKLSFNLLHLKPAITKYSEGMLLFYLLDKALKNDYQAQAQEAPLLNASRRMKRYDQVAIF